MLSALMFWLSPARRRFMRALARPGLRKLKNRLAESGSPQAMKFITILADANADFMAYALSPDGPLEFYRSSATPELVEACFGDLLIYAVNLFARDEFSGDSSELIALLARVLKVEPARVMLKRDRIRKAPRSEEWMLFTRLVEDLGGAPPAYGRELERRFGYQYLSYIGQYRPLLERALARGSRTLTRASR